MIDMYAFNEVMVGDPDPVRRLIYNKDFKNVCGLHYTHEVPFNQQFGSTEYKRLVDHVGADFYALFTNDVEWCQNNLAFFDLEDKETFIIKPRSPHIDPLLMCFCDMIIVTDDFSGWAATLSDSEIYYHQGLKDYDSDWIEV